jgi:hypothetical protein
MIHVENQVCSIELSKRLKALGVKQESYFYWIEYDEKKKFVALLPECEMQPELSTERSTIAAFAVDDLIRKLPGFLGKEYEYLLTIRRDTEDSWCGTYEYNFSGPDQKDPLIEIGDESLPNVLAKMLIYGIENKLIIL